MSEPLYVDPENLATYSRPYVAASQQWSQLADTVADLRARYQGVWGDDELGRQFGPSFVEGMDSIEQRVKTIGTTLTGHAEGLVESTRIFRDAREDADFVANTFRIQTEPIGTEAPRRENLVAATRTADTMLTGTLPNLVRLPSEKDTAVLPDVVHLPTPADGGSPPAGYVRSVNPHDQPTGTPENLVHSDAVHLPLVGERPDLVHLPGPHDQHAEPPVTPIREDELALPVAEGS
ncbi:hypothetical protein [Micromonospora sp. HUAS LYJ1]|uniref:hypothetical protein n=1 Tax=Micromonospora sp. HUAS LYJ1 TaxID=3061626 RepID=UPI0026733EEC|nr:hypothetical protein [Micromonospora sp. HUAS LYJ1]WKU05340.1 hypothetical protein Q2K16_32160 [Micromonospora sp. HUAS LYJ1]